MVSQRAKKDVGTVPAAWFDQIGNLFCASHEKSLLKTEPTMVDGMLRFPWPRQQPAVVWDTWMHAYHGTRAENSCSIIWQGGMKPPSEAGVLVVHGQRGSFNKRSIYVTPARGLAEHPLYSKLFPLDDQHYGQLVLELRVDPTTIAVKAL